ncbi:unnamed protein product [Rotaria sp. Silwood1]|nr:unnamed protein product [Rotaria sp. Silwood1]
MMIMKKDETKFYFSKQSPKCSIKGLTNKEIEAYGGLDHDYECITIKPKKGYVVLFTHNLLHKAITPEIDNSNDVKECVVLRTDVIVKRKENPLIFAITLEEQDDYHACFNCFREAEQLELKMHSDYSQSVNKIYVEELYERSFSIQYRYPHIFQLKSEESIINQDEQKQWIKQLPTEMWLSTSKHLDKQDIQHLVFAFPNF